MMEKSSCAAARMAVTTVKLETDETHQLIYSGLFEC